MVEKNNELSTMERGRHLHQNFLSTLNPIRVRVHVLLKSIFHLLEKKLFFVCFCFLIKIEEERRIEEKPWRDRKEIRK